MKGWINGWINEQINEQINDQSSGWMKEWMNEWMNKGMRAWRMSDLKRHSVLLFSAWHKTWNISKQLELQNLNCAHLLDFSI